VITENAMRAWIAAAVHARICAGGLGALGRGGRSLRRWTVMGWWGSMARRQNDEVSDRCKAGLGVKDTGSCSRRAAESSTGGATVGNEAPAPQTPKCCWKAPLLWELRVGAGTDPRNRGFAAAEKQLEAVELPATEDRPLLQKNAETEQAWASF
jgi:hypothetical protein